MIPQILMILVCVVVTQIPATRATAAFNTSSSSTASITAATLDAPTVLGIVANGNVLSCALNLNWTPAIGAPANVGYVVQRYLGGTASGAPQTLGAGVSTLLDSTVSMLWPYTWKVHAKLGNWVSLDASYSYTITSGCL